MMKGQFRAFCHDHHFDELQPSQTRMRDVMEFAAPFGPIGLVVERLVLKRHMLQLLLRRNECIRRTAESTEWQGFVP